MTDVPAIGYDVYDISTEDLIPRENVVISHDKAWLHQADDHGQFQEPEPGRQGNQGHADP